MCGIKMGVKANKNNAEMDGITLLNNIEVSRFKILQVCSNFFLENVFYIFFQCKQLSYTYSQNKKL